MFSKDFLGLIPIGAMILGSGIGISLKLSTTPRAILLAIAAGLVTASVVTDVVPCINEAEGDIKKQIFAMVGIAVGAVLMLTIKVVEPKPADEKCKPTASPVDSPGETPSPGKIPAHSTKKGFPWALVVAIAADMFLDGVVIGQGLHGKVSPGFIAAMTVEGLIISSTIMNTVKERGGSWGWYSTAFGIMAGGSLLGVFAGHWIGDRLGTNGKLVLMGAALSVVMWIVVMELMPEALENSGAWWVPGLWLLGTAGGIVLDWVTEAGGGGDSGAAPVTA